MLSFIVITSIRAPIKLGKYTVPTKRARAQNPSENVESTRHSVLLEQDCRVDSTFFIETNPFESLLFPSRKPFSRSVATARESQRRACASPTSSTGCSKRVRSRRAREARCRHRLRISSSMQAHTSSRRYSQSSSADTRPEGWHPHDSVATRTASPAPSAAR